MQYCLFQPSIFMDYFAYPYPLERDLITQRKVWLPHRPGPGDLLVFPNTAAYHSDLSAASASRWPAAAKFAVVHRGGEFEICPDDEYSPVAARNGAEVM